MSKNIFVVLVAPLYARNIGNVARAMANIGLNQLILIRAECIQNVDDFEARQGAARGQGPLKDALQLSDWDDFDRSCKPGITIAFSRRPGKLRPVTLWNALLASRDGDFWYDSEQPIYLVFGPEDAGLSTADLDRSHHICELPIYGEHGSLNLAHAVLLALYIFRQNYDDCITRSVQFNDGSNYDADAERSMVVRSQLRSSVSPEDRPGSGVVPEAVLHEWLTAIGMSVEKRGVSAYSVLKRLFLRNEPTEKEMRILNVVLFQTVRKLKEKDLSN